jgi:hypothetical protein
MNTQLRLSYIAETNPEWFSYIMDFVERNPIFSPYLYMVALEPKNQKHKFFPETIKKAVLYYICFAGVRSDFGQKLWLHVKDLSTKEEVLASTIISPKKKEYLEAAIQLPDTLSLDELKRIKIKGIGVSGIAFITKNFSDTIETELVEYTDIGILGGIQKIYKLDHRPTPNEALAIINTWGNNKSVGNMFCNQAYHYA